MCIRDRLYVAVKECEVPRPVKELRGFEKILLAPGETKTVTFTLDKRDFSYWNDEAHCFHMPEGVYEIQIGASAHEVLLSQEIRAKEEPLNLKKIFPSIPFGISLPNSCEAKSK